MGTTLHPPPLPTRRRCEVDVDTERDGVLAEELRAAMPLQQVRQLPGAAANAELRRRGLWPLTAQDICFRLGLPAQGLGAAADHRFAASFGGLGLKSSTRVTLPILLSKLCQGMAGLLNADQGRAACARRGADP